MVTTVCDILNDDVGRWRGASTFSTPWQPSSLLHPAHSPDVASLRAEAVEHHPFPVRRPDRVVDSYVGVGKFVDLLRLPSVHWRTPEYLVPYDIHDAGAIR